VPERITKHRLVGKRLRTRVECKAAALMQHHRPLLMGGKSVEVNQPWIVGMGRRLERRYHEPASGSARAGRLGSQRAGAARGKQQRFWQLDLRIGWHPERARRMADGGHDCNHPAR
jgi:hypothetical protein